MHQSSNKFLPFLPLAVFAVILAHAPLTQSLWLDETITAWISGGSVVEAFALPTQFQGQSPLYFLFMWGWGKVFGGSELALRLPSILGIVGVLWATRWLCKRWLGVAVAAPLLLLLALDPVLVALCSARPYAIALFCSVLSLIGFVVWVDSGKVRHLFSFLLFFVLAVYLHYFFGAILGVQLLYLLLHWRTKKVSFNWLVFAVLSLFTVSAPAMVHMFVLSGQAGSIGFLNPPSPTRVTTALFPPLACVALVAALLLSALFGKERLHGRAPLSWKAMIVVSLWYLTPPLALYAYSVWGPYSLFAERYFLIYSPAVALLLASGFLLIPPGRATTIALLVLAGTILVREVDRKWQIEDWRSAVQIANRIVSSSNAHVLIYSGLVESSDPTFYKSDESISYLSTPALVYRLTSRAMPVPPHLDSTHIIEEGVLNKLTESPTVVWLGANKTVGDKNAPDSWRTLLSERGFGTVKELQSGAVVVLCASKEEGKCG